MDFSDFELFAQKNTSSAAMVKKHLGAELSHTQSGAPLVEGHAVSLSDTQGVVFLAVLKGKGSIGVDAESLSRKPPRGFFDIYEWTDLEAYCKATGENLFRTVKSRPNTADKSVKMTRLELNGCAVSVCVTPPLTNK